MALGTNEPKVKYGLKRLAFAIATIADDGTATYGTPVTLPGARSLSLEGQGSGEITYADDGAYYIDTVPSTRQGDLEMVRFIDAFLQQVLGYIKDTDGSLMEDMNAGTVHFALLFETNNDKKPTRYVIYNCIATAPVVGSATTEDGKNIQTETSQITSLGIYDAARDKWVSFKRSSPDTDATSYAAWFNEVQLPKTPASEPSEP